MENTSNLISFRETTKKILEINEEKMNNFTKSVKNQLENMELGMKSYVKTLIEAERKSINVDFENMETKIGSIKMENHRYAIEMKNNAAELKVEKDEFLKIKTEVVEKLDSSNKHFDELNTNTVEKFTKLIADHEVIRTKFNEIAEFVKVSIINLITGYSI